MSLYKRKKTWWTDFSINGQRYRQSLDASDWREAQHKEKELIAQASQGKLVPSSQQFVRLGFSEAAKRHLEDRRAHLAARSIQTEKERQVPLKAYFGSVPLARITADALREYIASRREAGIANKTINNELGVLRGVLKRAKRWHLVSDEIKPLPVRQNVGRALTHDEKVRLLRAAHSNPDWLVARCAIVLALNTTMRDCELKGLRWRDIDLLERTLTVTRSKTEAGERVIPVNADAMGAIMELHRRAEAFRGTEPLHYVFPACKGGKIDPTGAQRSWRAAWRSIKKAAGVHSLRFHDLRHHAITELAESQASDQTTMSIAGHVSPKMLAHYSHVRLEAKRQALDSLASRPAKEPKDGVQEGSYVTKNVTNDKSVGDPSAQVQEKTGGRDGTRTHYPLVANQVLSQLSYTPFEAPESKLTSSREKGKRVFVYGRVEALP